MKLFLSLLRCYFWTAFQFRIVRSPAHSVAQSQDHAQTIPPAHLLGGWAAICPYRRASCMPGMQLFNEFNARKLYGEKNSLEGVLSFCVWTEEFFCCFVSCFLFCSSGFLKGAVSFKRMRSMGLWMLMWNKCRAAIFTKIKCDNANHAKWKPKLFVWFTKKDQWSSSSGNLYSW